MKHVYTSEEAFNAIRAQYNISYDDEICIEDESDESTFEIEFDIPNWFEDKFKILYQKVTSAFKR